MCIKYHSGSIAHNRKMVNYNGEKKICGYLRLSVPDVDSMV